MQDALTGGGSAPQATPAGGDFSMGSTVQPVPTSGGMSFGVEAPSAPAVQPVPSSGGLSFGNIAPPAPAPAPSPYDMATQRLRRLYEMPPPQPGTPAAKSYKSMVDHYEGMVKAFEPEEVKVSEAEQEIARLESIGIPRAVAIRIKEGVYETARHPVTQEVQVIDKSTGQLVYGQSQPTTPAPIEPANTTPLEFGTPYESAESSFGIGGKLAGWLNTAGDVTGMGVPFPGIQSAQSDFGVMRENLTNRISEAYDGRVPAFLLKGIQDLTPKAGSLFEGPAAAQEKLEALGRNLTTERNSVQRQLTSRALSPTDRAKLETRLGTLESSLTEIRTAIVGFGSDQGLRPDVADRLKAYE